MFETVRRKIFVRARRLMPVRVVRRFARHQGGVAAVEFAFIAVPFLALLFAILETALVFFAGQTLEAAVSDSARLIMTGQAQTASYNQNTFKTALCNNLAGGLFDCTNGIYVNVQTYSNFNAVSTTAPVTNGQLDTSNFKYQPGGPGDIVVVQVYYQWPIYVSLLGLSLSNLNNSYRLLVATSVFRNEPYQ